MYTNAFLNERLIHTTVFHNINWQRLKKNILDGQQQKRDDQARGVRLPDISPMLQCRVATMGISLRYDTMSILSLTQIMNKKS